MPSLNTPHEGHPALQRLPPEVRATLFDPHYLGAAQGQSTSIRFPRMLEESMDKVIGAVQREGGALWMNSRADLVRAALYVYLALMEVALLDPPPELRALLASERIQAAAKMQAHMEEQMVKAVELRSKQVASMLKDPDDHVEVRILLTGLLAELDHLGPYWKRRWLKEIQKDRTLNHACQEADLSLELPETPSLEE